MAKQTKCIHTIGNEAIIADYPIQDEQWPSRRWNKDRTEYEDLSGCNCPIATPEDIKLGYLHNINDQYFVTNEGTKKDPAYHVWVAGITHANCDSAYNELDMAIARCNYLANRIK